MKWLLAVVYAIIWIDPEVPLAADCIDARQTEVLQAWIEGANTNQEMAFKVIATDPWVSHSSTELTAARKNEFTGFKSKTHHMTCISTILDKASIVVYEESSGTYKE